MAKNTKKVHGNTKDGITRISKKQEKEIMKLVAKRFRTTLWGMVELGLFKKTGGTVKSRDINNYKLANNFGSVQRLLDLHRASPQVKKKLAGAKTQAERNKIYANTTTRVVRLIADQLVPEKGTRRVVKDGNHNDMFSFIEISHGKNKDLTRVEKLRKRSDRLKTLLKGVRTAVANGKIMSVDLLEKIDEYDAGEISLEKLLNYIANNQDDLIDALQEFYPKDIKTNIGGTK